jgi:hypothetical protein
VPSSTVWISYDLGVRGDYESLYAWLDAHDAKECGDSVAVFTYTYEGSSLLATLTADLKSSVTIDKRSRIYVICREQAERKSRGRFIFGNRRAAPWTGYAHSETESVDDEI